MEVEARPKIIGARVQRVEDPRLLTGHGTFIDDINLPGTLHIAFARSDYGHARITGIEVAEAVAMPGVYGVFTAHDIDGLINPIRATSRMVDYHATELPVLAAQKVRFVGEPVHADQRRVANGINDTVIDLPVKGLAGAGVVHEFNYFQVAFV